MQKREKREIRRQNRQQAEKEYLKWRNTYVILNLLAFILVMYGLSNHGFLLSFLMLSVMILIIMCYTLRKFLKCQRKLEKE
jgi:uncharacterized ion transporter superfamily protein YfcC